MSERHACQLVNQPRGTQRYQPTQRDDEDQLTQGIIALASQYGRYGYRPDHGGVANGRLAGGQGSGRAHLRREGLKIPQRQKPRGRLWRNDGSCVRLRPERPNHV
jgi:putative transposase